LSNHSISSGGSNDGFYSNTLLSTESISHGSNDDGSFSITSFSNESIYKGDESDGFDLTRLDTIGNLYKGGADDGFYFVKRIVEFVWTGAIGTGWNNPGNWSSNTIPNISSPVIIPAAVPNFPFVNTGLLSIGTSFNPTTYFSKSIHILDGAEMTLRINATLENYGDLKIDGDLFILNISDASVRNINTGRIIIGSDGSLVFQ
ncbi:MAG: hypothetical protein AAGK97_08560, partial [Bacteroidota bacterium]